jgi:predicted HAD superfamily phosphohydrolase YqeG
MGINLNEAAVVGDQIFPMFTEGTSSICLPFWLVPIDKREVLIVRLKRFAEKVVLTQH